MTRPIFVYEVMVKLTYRTSTPPQMMTRLEHAYSVADACSQAVYALVDDDIEKAKIMSVGPPLEAVRAQEVELPAIVAEAISKAISKDKMTAVDVVGLIGECKATIARRI